MITQQRLIELFHYNKITGILTKRSTGKIQTSTDAGGNIRVMIEGKTYTVQQLAFLYVDGEIPKGHIVHKDGNRKNNSIDNLEIGQRTKKLFVDRRNETTMNNLLAGYDPEDKFTHKLKLLFDKNYRIHGRHLRRTEGSITVYLIEYERYINAQLGRF